MMGRGTHSYKVIVFVSVLEHESPEMVFIEGGKNLESVLKILLRTSTSRTAALRVSKLRVERDTEMRRRSSP